MQYDKEFLKALDLQRNKVIYARIIALSFDERPIETIEGRVTSGSVNVDGASAVRRTCQLSLVTEVVNISDYIWSLGTKFKLEIGVENFVDTKYPEVIWFKQGTYVITSFSQALQTSSYNINISGKDKMCLLNGEIGGSLTAKTDFGKYEDVDKNGDVRVISYPIKQIIRDAVHQFANEPFHNIIINDLDDTGLELQEYRYDTPLYLIRKADNLDTGFSYYENGTLNGDHQVWLLAGKDGAVREKSTPISELNAYDTLVNLDTSTKPTEFLLDPNKKDERYVAAKISYGQTAGYTETELTYAGELVANAGEAITSVLDKIKNMLGIYEYFYDVDGRFIFQQKEEYVNTTWTPLTDNGVVESNAYSSSYIYSFSGNELITAFNNTPNISNLKNDFSVWGTRKSAAGTEIPVHMRYAIDKKPIVYKSIQVYDDELIDYNKKYDLMVLGQNSKVYLADERYGDYANELAKVPQIARYNTRRLLAATRNSRAYEVEDDILILFTKGEAVDDILQIEASGIVDSDDPDVLIVSINTGEPKEYLACDWRELIYQMAEDYFKYSHLDDFEQRVAAANPVFFPTGQTGYEQYYTDLEGFWRELYNYENHYSKVSLPEKEELDQYYEKTKNYTVVTEFTNGQKLYKQISGDGESAVYERALPPYDGDMTYYTLEEKYIRTKDREIDKEKIYYKRDKTFNSAYDRRPYWNKIIFDAPDQLFFWFDFLDAEGELDQFSTKAIGDRPKVTNDKDVKSIYYRETPLIVFASSLPTAQKPGYRYFNMDTSGFKNMFSQSTQGKSAKEAIDELLYNHAYCSESVSLTTIPIYYLEPNKRIYINDVNTGINGDYIMSKFSVPLTHNGTMSITATKAVTRLF